MNHPPDQDTHSIFFWKMEDLRKCLSTNSNVTIKYDISPCVYQQIEERSSILDAKDSFVCPDVKNYLKSQKDMHVSRASWNDTSIWIYGPRSTLDFLSSYMMSFIYMVDNTLGSWCRSKKKNPKKKIVICMSPKRKMWGRKSKMGICHVNSGQTDFRNKTISIWRLEEWDKVLIHELLHWYNWEHNLEQNTIVRNADEAWVETWATIIHLVSITDSLNSFSEKWQSNLQWATSQRDLLLQNKSKMNWSTCSVDAYYILKCHILQYIDKIGINQWLSKIEEYRKTWKQFVSAVTIAFTPLQFVHENKGTTLRMTRFGFHYLPGLLSLCSAGPVGHRISKDLIRVTCVISKSTNIQFAYKRRQQQGQHSRRGISLCLKRAQTKRDEFRRVYKFLLNL